MEGSETKADTAGSTSSRSLRNLRRFLYLLAVIPVVAGSVTALFGSASIPSSGEPSASIESELRFYSVWWIGAGLFVAWLARRIEHRTGEFRIFCGLLFLAGFSRLLAALDAGWPHPSQLVLMALEFVLPVVLVIWQASVVSNGSVKPGGGSAMSGPAASGRLQSPGGHGEASDR